MKSSNSQRTLPSGQDASCSACTGTAEPTSSVRSQPFVSANCRRGNGMPTEIGWVAASNGQSRMTGTVVLRFVVGGGGLKGVSWSSIRFSYVETLEGSSNCHSDAAPCLERGYTDRPRKAALSQARESG